MLRISPQCNERCINFQSYVFRHSTSHMRKPTFELPPAKACQAPVAERPVVLPPELNHISSIRHFRTSSDRVVPSAVRQCGYRTLRPIDPRTTGARSSARRAIIRSMSLSSTTTSEPVPSRTARHGTRPPNRLVSPPGENVRGLGLAEKRTKNSGVMIVAFAAVAAWQIYDMATATETPSRALMILQYVLLAGLLVGLAGSLLNFLRSQ